MLSVAQDDVSLVDWDGTQYINLDRIGRGPQKLKKDHPRQGLTKKDTKGGYLLEGDPWASSLRYICQFGNRWVPKDGCDVVMAKKTPMQSKTQVSDPDKRGISDYSRDFIILRRAIIDNCLDCIRDCGRDCLDLNVKPIENIRCPLQKVRIDYNMVIEEDFSLNHGQSAQKETRVGPL